jgi:hypothetical protein
MSNGERSPEATISIRGPDFYLVVTGSLRERSATSAKQPKLNARNRRCYQKISRYVQRHTSSRGDSVRFYLLSLHARQRLLESGVEST